MSEIKVTGTPMKYGDGATRNTKKGKGRFDLIPPEPMEFIDRRISEIDSTDNFEYLNDELDVYRRAMRIHNSFGILEHEIDNIADAIISLIMIRDGCGSMYYDRDAFFTTFFNELMKTMKELAVHFENGANIYGEHNCEKGIPKWSFIDSGLRHLTQFLSDENDENHYIAAIWNFWMLLWTVIKEKTEFDDTSMTLDKLEEQATRISNIQRFDPNEMIGVVIDPELVPELVDENKDESDGDDDE